MDSERSPNHKVIPGDLVGRKHVPMCKVCRSEFRKAIDKLIVTPNISYREIVRMFPDEDISLSSVANHAKKHLEYEQAAIHRIMEEEARAVGATIEEGVRGEAAQRTFLATFLQKAHDALLDDNLALSGKEAMKAIEMLQEREEKAYAAEMDKLQRQFRAYQRAMQELVPPDLWQAILERTRELYEPPVVVVSSIDAQPVLESAYEDQP